MNALKKIIFIVGPTAVGKSDVAFFLAKEINGEIISCDSMQVYKDVNIASNKPSQKERSEVPHHLIDIVSLEENFDVSRFNKLACDKINEIHQKIRIPIVCGGSGLYMQVLLDGIFPGSPKDAYLRQKLGNKAEAEGKQCLHDMLKQQDPQAAEKIHVNDLKKVIRALEVCILENKPISEIQKQREGLWGKYDINIFCLTRERESLYAIIERRVDKMFDQGIVEEIKKIKGINLSYGAKSIIGLKEINGYIEGKHDIDHAKDLMKMHTRRLAKRQLTWFRREKRMNFFLLNGQQRDAVVQAIREAIHL